MLVRAFCLIWMVLLVWSYAATGARAAGIWQQLENNSNCKVWNDNPKQDEIVTWTGDCLDERTSGEGTLVWRYFEDGEWKEGTYTGLMSNGRAHGHGVVVYWDTGGGYEGDWKEGKRHGYGVIMFASGDRYEGEFKGGKWYGRGTLTIEGGSWCDAEWNDEKIVERYAGSGGVCEDWLEILD